MHLKCAREEKGLKQKRVSGLIGITSSALCRIERGYNLPKVSTLKKLCEHLGLDTESHLSMLHKARANRSTKQVGPAEETLSAPPPNVRAPEPGYEMPSYILKKWGRVIEIVAVNPRRARIVEMALDTVLDAFE
jgi:transcriptional regulator with XRE-family HTH domain